MTISVKQIGLLSILQQIPLLHDISSNLTDGDVGARRRDNAPQVEGM